MQSGSTPRSGRFEANRSEAEGPAPGDAVAWLMPGLGSRYVGMGADILGCDISVNELVVAAERFLGYDIAEVCLTGSGRKVVPNRVEAQVIYVVNCAYTEALFARGETPAVLAGHSLGTWAAAYAAGAIDFLSGLKLVTLVEDLLEKFASKDPQAMGAVIGLCEETVAEWCADRGDVFIANRNSPGQTVISGRAEAVDAVLQLAAEQGAHKAKRIAAARAMHTPLLSEVAAELREALTSYSIAEAAIPLLNCHVGGSLQGAVEIREYLSDFLRQPVNWEGAMRELIAAKVSEFREVGAGNLLGSMMSFIDGEVEVESVSDWLSRAPNQDSGHGRELRGALTET